MILETEDERNAFEYLCSLADDLTDRRGCNDLSKEECSKFGHLPSRSYDIETKTFIERKVSMDFDVIQWLKEQVKKNE